MGSRLRGNGRSWLPALALLLALALRLESCGAAAAGVPPGCINNGAWVPLLKPRDYAKPCASIQQKYKCAIGAAPGRVLPNGHHWVTTQPSCRVPQMSPMALVKLLRNKVLFLVGDSLVQNLFHALSCSIEGLSLPGATVTQTFHPARGAPFKVSRVLAVPSFNASIVFQFVAYLSESGGTPHVNQVVRLDLPNSKITSVARYASIVVFGGGHWFNHVDGTLWYKGPPSANTLVTSGAEAWPIAVGTALKTIGAASFKGPIIFKTYSTKGLSAPNCGSVNWKPLTAAEGVRHMGKGPWPTAATFNQVALKVIAQLKPSVKIMDISWLTYLRPDAHLNGDCSHFCLPGLPDTWADMLYQKLVEVITPKGKWREVPGRPLGELAETAAAWLKEMGL